MITTYSAKWVLPIDGPPIENGEVIVEDSYISAVRSIKSPANERNDLGNSILLPGLINAHTHLEYTALRGFLEDVPFFIWIRTLNASKANLDSDDWILSAKLGALESIASGTTTICDNTDSGAAMDAALWSGLRGRIYQEFFNIDHCTSVEETVDGLVAKLAALESRKGSRLDVGISPHAPYTIRPAMFDAVRRDPRLRGRPISIHVAESPAESLLIESGQGPFGEMFQRRGIVWQTPGVSPTKYVSDQGAVGPQSLLIHCVHQSSDDIATVVGSGAAIIHCPKSNAKLGAGIAPLMEWLKQDGIRLGIGTDSAVSNNSLDLFEEMRFAVLAQRGKNEAVEGVTASDVLSLATSRGAEAIGLGSSIGTLTPGKKADMIAVGLDGLHMVPSIDPGQSLVYSARSSDVKMTMIDGEVCYDDGRFVNVDLSEFREQIRALKDKLSRVGS